MHRPIVKSKTAVRAFVTPTVLGKKSDNLIEINTEIFDYLEYTIRDENEYSFQGIISSYNRNTFKGRVYVLTEARPIPFELSQDAHDVESITLIVQSLAASAISGGSNNGVLFFRGFKSLSKSGRLKGIYIFEVSRTESRLFGDSF
jgi:hypothetical protein